MGPRRWARYGRGMRPVSFLVFEGVPSLDVAGPLEVFATANSSRRVLRASPRGSSRAMASPCGPRALLLRPRRPMRPLRDGLCSTPSFLPRALLGSSGHAPRLGGLFVGMARPRCIGCVRRGGSARRSRRWWGRRTERDPALLRRRDADHAARRRRPASRLRLSPGCRPRSRRGTPAALRCRSW